MFITFVTITYNISNLKMACFNLWCLYKLFILSLCFMYLYGFYFVQSKEENYAASRNEFKLLESKISKLEENYQNQINDLKNDNENLRRELKRGLAAVNAKCDTLSGKKEQYKTDIDEVAIPEVNASSTSGSRGGAPGARPP